MDLDNASNPLSPLNLTTPPPWDPEQMRAFQEDLAREFLASLRTFTAPFSVALIVLYALVFVIGLVGNVLVIVVIVRLRHMRTVTNLFFLNLAVGDLLVVCVCMPFTLAPYLYKNWLFGSAICKLTPFAQGTSVSVSVLTLLTVSVDRCYAIYQPIKARLFITRGRVYAVLAVVWVAAILISLPMLFVNHVQTHDVILRVTVHRCQESWPLGSRGKNVYNLCVFVVLYAVPVLIMAIAYSMIAKTLWTGKREVFGCNQSALPCKSVLNGRRKIARLLFLVVVTFISLWLPYHVTNIYLDQSAAGGGAGGRQRAAVVAAYVYPVCQWLALANSSTNPVFFCLISKTFRAAFTATCCCRSLQGSDFEKNVYTRFSSFSHTKSSSSDARRRSSEITHKINVANKSSLLAELNGASTKDKMATIHEYNVPVLTSPEDMPCVVTNCFNIMSAQTRLKSETKSKMAADKSKMAADKSKMAVDKSKMDAEKSKMAAEKSKMAVQSNMAAVEKSTCVADEKSIGGNPYWQSADTMQFPPCQLTFKETISPVGCPLASVETISSGSSSDSLADGVGFLGAECSNISQSTRRKSMEDIPDCSSYSRCYDRSHTDYPADIPVCLIVGHSSEDITNEPEL